MEQLVKEISRKYNVSARVLEAVATVLPHIPYTDQELVALCNENKVPVMRPEVNTGSLILLAAKRMRGMGTDFIVSRATFFRFASFEGATRVWDYYINHLFDGLTIQRLYINNVRVDFEEASCKGNMIKFTTASTFPEGAEFNHLHDKSIFINDTLYNVSKVSVQRGGLVFLWTTP